MSIRAVCTRCLAEYRLKDEAAGKKVRCKKCGELFEVLELLDEPDVLEDPYEPDEPAAETSAFDDAFGAKETSRNRSRTGRGTQPSPRPTPRGSPDKKRSDSDGTLAIRIIGGAIAAVLLLTVIGLAVLQPWKWGQPDKDAPRGAQPGTPGWKLAGEENSPRPVQATAPFPVSAIPLPQFPELGPSRAIPESAVTVHDVRFGAESTGAADPTRKSGWEEGVRRTAENAVARAPAMQMELRLYIPPGQAPERSRGCVLVGPAGTNLLTGNGLDNPNYHEEALPYAEAGYVTAVFSLDGAFVNSDEIKEAELAQAYRQFRDAHAGLANARAALEFVLARVPQVDPKRIVIAGHSSAATLALLFAEHEPRLKGCIAYAPATDLEIRLGQVASNPRMQTLLPGIESFVRQSSPRRHMARLNGPVFLFHALDDSKEPFFLTESFATDLQRTNKNVTFVKALAGDHYESMVREGIPRAIEWLRSLPGEQGQGT